MSGETRGVLAAMGTTINRRAVLRGTLAAALTLPAARSITATAQDAPGGPAIFPLAGTRTASEGTEISFRGIAPDELGAVEVTGSVTGHHAGVVMPHGDGEGASFVPDAPFAPRESVTVRWQRAAPSFGGGTFAFAVAESLPPAAETVRNQPAAADEVQSFRSRPDLRPPHITVLANNGDTAEGLLFLAPKRGRGQNGPMIVDNEGGVVWYHPIEIEVEEPLDFRPQTYQGQPVITWWQGILAAAAQGVGHWVILDATYREVAIVKIGNGYYGGGLHEFTITPRDTALVTVYNRVRWDTRAIGGVEDGIAIDGIIQEIEIATGRVLFEWHSLDFVALEDSYVKANEENPGAAIDYYHINSAAETEDGGIVTSARNTWAIYKIDRLSGEVLWRLGGKHSDFAMGEGAAPATQHDAHLLSDGELTLFDNADGQAEGAYSRGLLLALDVEAMTAEVAQEYVRPEKLLSLSQGNMQRLENGNFLVGWGSESYVSEFSADGTLLFDAQISANKHSYRAYRAPWTGTPDSSPDVAIEPGSGGRTTVYASWNGATGVSAWQVTGAESDYDSLVPLADPVPRAGFETEIVLDADAPFISVEALDADGNVLGRSPVIEL
jgi:hypothetical protein